MINLVEGFWFCATHLGYFCVFAAAAYGLGRRFFGRLQFHSLPEEIAFSVALGLGTLATIFFGFGVLNLFNRPLVILTLAVSIISATGLLRVLLGRLGSALRCLRPSRRWSVLAGVLCVWIPLLAEAMYPPRYGDATMYHLPAARAFASSHALVAMPNLRYPVFPQLNELLWGAALLVSGDVLAQLLSLLFYLVVLTATVGLALRMGGPTAAAWGAGLWLASPIVLLLAGSAHVEMALTAFVTLAVCAVIRWRECREPKWLVVGGLFIGFAAGTKYPGLFFVIALLSVVLLDSGRGQRGRSAAAFTLAALAAAAPWYGRNVFYAGNPVWPFLSNVFGYRFWTPADVASVVWSLRREGWSQGGSPLLELPWNLVFRQPGGEGGLAPALFALLPVGIAYGLVRSWARWVVGLSIAYFGFWFYTTQQMRFLLPLVPSLCVLVALGCYEGVTTLRRGARKGWLFAAGVTGFLVLAGPQLIKAGRRSIAAGPPPVTATARDKYLAGRLPTYEFYRSANAERGNSYVVYTFHDEPMKYYCEGTHLGDWFGRGRYSDMDLRTGASLFRSLRSVGAEFLLVDSRTFPTALPGDPFFREHFVPVFARPGIAAFKLRLGDDGTRKPAETGLRDP